MPAPLASRDAVLDRLTETFKACGYDGASLADLSKATGLGKSSLYHHFPGGKEEMAAAVLDRLSEQLGASLLAPLAGPGAPADRVRAMLATVDGLYGGGTRPCLVGAIALDSVAPLFRDRLSGILTAWVDALAATLREAGVEDAERRARDAVARIQGALVLARATGDTTGFRETLVTLRRELAA